MSRKFGFRTVTVGALALMLGCSGDVDATNPNEADPVGDDSEITEQEFRISGASKTVTAPTNLTATRQTESSIELAWGQPREGLASNYIVYLNGRAKSSTTALSHTHEKLACGTSYLLEVAARDATGRASARAGLRASTTPCSTSTTPDAGSPTSSVDASSPTAPTMPSPLTGYAAAVMADAPVSYWRLNESSGVMAADLAGGRAGTYTNGVVLGASGAMATDTAASFDGKDDFVMVPDSEALRLNGSFSIEFMARLSTVTNAYPGILVKGSAAATSTGYVVYYHPTRRQPSFKRAGLDGMSTTAAAALSSERFQHYVFTYDAGSSTARWYAAGVLDATFSSVRFPTSFDTSAFQLGRGDVEAGLAQYGNQTLDEVAVYKTVLSADRVKAHFSSSGLVTVVAPTPTAPAPTTPTPTAPVPTTPTPSIPGTSSAWPIGLCAYQTSDFPAIAAAGIKHVRMDKPTAATIELARTHGIEVLPIADYGYADLTTTGNAKHPPLPEYRAEWAKRMVDKWRGMQNPPKVIEVWNEPWLAGFWAGKPDPAAYLELVKAFTKEAWAVWPNLTILVSADQGMRDYPTFRRDMLAADTGKLLADPRILPTTHNYVEARTPVTVTSNSCTYDLNRYECAFRDFKAHGHPNPQVWVTEFGWESNSPAPSEAHYGAVSEAVQAQYTIDALEMFRKSGMVAAAYSFMWNTNDKWAYNWLRADNSQKPIVGKVRDYIRTH